MRRDDICLYLARNCQITLKAEGFSDVSKKLALLFKMQQRK